jgi:hypothetical protein
MLLVLTLYVGHREANYTITRILTETEYSEAGNPHLITLKMYLNILYIQYIKVQSIAEGLRTL